MQGEVTGGHAWHREREHAAAKKDGDGTVLAFYLIAAAVGIAWGLTALTLWRQDVRLTELERRVEQLTTTEEPCSDQPS